MAEQLLFYLLKIIFSAFENFGELMIGLALFRYSYRNFLKEIILLAIIKGILMTLAYDVFIFHFLINEATDLFINFVFIAVLIKSSKREAVLIGFSAYLLKTTILATTSYVGLSLSLFTAADMMFKTHVTFSVQVINLFVLIGIALVLDRYKYGFIINREIKEMKIILRKINLFIYTFMLIDVIAMGIITYSAVNNHELLALFEFLFIFGANLIFYLIYLRSNEELAHENSKVDFSKIKTRLLQNTKQ